MSPQLSTFSRLVCFWTLICFFPSSIGVWNFVPLNFGVAQAEMPGNTNDRIAVNPNKPSLMVRENDLTLPISDSESLSFERIYVNDNGNPQPTDTARLGIGWRHNLDLTSTQLDSPAFSSVRCFYEGEPEKGKLTKVQAQGTSSKLVLRYDDSDRLTKAAVMENRTEVQSITYGYDKEGRLIEAVRNDGKSVGYEYRQISSSVVMTKVLDAGGSCTDIAWTFSSDPKTIAAIKIEVTSPNTATQAYE